MDTLVVINSTCATVESVSAWFKNLKKQEVTLLLYAPVHYHPGYQMRYLRDIVNPGQLRECPLYAPNEHTRALVDAYILKDRVYNLYAGMATTVWLLSPSRDSWPLPNDFDLSRLNEETGHMSWNPLRLGLYRIK